MQLCYRPGLTCFIANKTNDLVQRRCNLSTQRTLLYILISNKHSSINSLNVNDLVNLLVPWVSIGLNARVTLVQYQVIYSVTLVRLQVVVQLIGLPTAWVSMRRIEKSRLIERRIFYPLPFNRRVDSSAENAIAIRSLALYLRTIACNNR